MTPFVGHLGTQFGEGKMAFETTRLTLPAQGFVFSYSNAQECISLVLFSTSLFACLRLRWQQWHSWRNLQRGCALRGNTGRNVAA